MSQIILRGPLGATVKLDSDKIFPDDPGQDTPMLICFRGDTATWNCGTSEGETGDGIKFPKKVLAWFDRIAPQVEAWEDAEFAKARLASK